MNDRKDVEKVQLALDTTFSNLKDDPWLAQKVLANAKGEVKVKKKLSFGLILVIVLVLAAVTALAVTLTSFYEKAIQQESESGVIQNWPVSEKVSLIHWMIDAGIQLDENEVAKLSDNSLSEAERDNLAMSIILAYYPARDTFLTTTDIIAKEYGEYEQWPLELRSWYTTALDKYQHEEKNGAFAKNVLPQEDEITEEEARIVADGCLTEILGLDATQIALLNVTTFFQEDTGDGEARRIWYFSYYDSDNKELKYYAYINNDGTLLDCGSTEVKATSASMINDEFRDLIAYHSSEFFSVEGFASFAKNFAPRILKVINDSDLDKWPAYFAQIPYALPDSKAISADTAEKAGIDAIEKTYGLTINQLDERYVSTLSYRIYSNDMHEWRLAFHIPQNGKTEALKQFSAGQIPYCIIVRIDPFTSDILSVQEEYDADQYWFGE